MWRALFIGLYAIGAIHVGAFYHQEAERKCFGKHLYWKTLTVSAAWPAMAFAITTADGLQDGCKMEKTNG